eukprot:scaffold8982_cov125-Isochrysis_galbana.AAC.13
MEGSFWFWLGVLSRAFVVEEDTSCACHMPRTNFRRAGPWWRQNIMVESRSAPEVTYYIQASG